MVRLKHLIATTSTLPWRGRVGPHRAKRDKDRDGVKVSRHRTVPEWRDHPTPSHISLRSCQPTLPLQGRVRKSAPGLDDDLGVGLGIGEVVESFCDTVAADAA